VTSVVAERRLARRDLALIAGTLTVGVGVVLGILLPWSPRPVGDGSLPADVLAFVLICVGFLAGMLSLVLVPPTGRVELVVNGIEFGPDFLVAWEKLASFDDGAAEFVRVNHRDDIALPAIPTPDDDTRRAVLAMLETRLPRASRS
jgi:hypothetical protein